MKFRHVLVILGGLILAVVLIAVGAVARYQPNHYKFLGDASPKKVVLEPDRIGWFGREARYYVVHKMSSAVAAEAQTPAA